MMQRHPHQAQRTHGRNSPWRGVLVLVKADAQL